MCVQKNSGNKICRQRYVYAKQMCIRHMHVRHAFMWILYCFKLYYIILYYIILYVNNLTLVPGLQFNRMLKCSAVSDATRTCASNHSVLFLAMWVLSHKSSGMKVNGFICIVWYMHYRLVPFDIIYYIILYYINYIILYDMILYYIILYYIIYFIILYHILGVSCNTNSLYLKTPLSEVYSNPLVVVY